jgi:dTDP-glucose 4,6-dehydratase
MADFQRSLVTGASGFLGAALTRRLVASGVTPCVLINSTSAGQPWRLLDVWPRLCIHESNLLDSRALQEVIETHPPTVIYHLAAFTHAGKSWLRASECFRTNVEGTLLLIDSLNRSNLNCHLVYGSTSEVYGNSSSPQSAANSQIDPLSPYASSKLAGEHACRVYAAAGLISLTVVRMFNIYGPGQSPDRIIPEAIVSALRERNLVVSRGTQTRDFIYLDDVVAGLLKLGESAPREVRLVDLASGMPVTIRSTVEHIYSAIGCHARPRFGELKERTNELWSVSGDPTTLRLLLGAVKPLDSGLEETIAWYRAHLEMWS